MTYGTYCNCECPHCNKNNIYVTDGVYVPYTEIKVFKGTCRHCHGEIEYTASWELMVKAEPYPGTFSKLTS